MSATPFLLLSKRYSSLGKPAISTVLIALLLHPLTAAVRGDHAAYVGGTVSTLKQGVEGTLDTSDETALRFAYQEGQFTLPYKQIVSLEFGQKVERRVVMSKKKKHYLTIGYRGEDGKGQAAVFEVAKGTVSSLIPGLEVRTGMRVEKEVAEDGWGEVVDHADTPRIPEPPPAPPLPPPAPASLTIESTSPGAEVIIDAQPAGVVPVTVKLPAGSHYLMLRKDGFVNWTRDVEAKAGESMTISADLKPVEETPNIIRVKTAAQK